MAFAKKTAPTTNAAPEVAKPRLDLQTLRTNHASVSRARQMSDTCILFNLRIGCIDLYSMRAVSGSKGEFVSAGQSKGKDGKWYDNYRVYLAQDSNDAIIAAVMKCLETGQIVEV